MIQIGNNKIKGAFLGKDELKYIYIGKTCVYYKETTSTGTTGGDTGGTQGIKVCFAVVDNISTYKDRIYDTVYDKGDKSWYFLNDVGEYEKYGVVDEVSTLDKATQVKNTKSCSVSLTSHGSWITSTTNPDSSTYDAYMSNGSHLVDNGFDIMVITLSTGFTEFDVYIRSCAETNYDYTVIGNLDSTVPTSNTDYSNSNVKAHTRGSQNSSTALSGYKKVSYTGIDPTKTHTIWVEYRKDSSVNYDDDRGYVLIPKLPAYIIQGTTVYDGKLVALSTDNHEYKYINGTWVDQGAFTTTSIPKYYAKYNGSQVKFRGIKSPWNNGYRIVLDANKKELAEALSIYPATDGSAPLELQEYGTYFYFDWHDPTSTTANTCDTSDYSSRVWGDDSYYNSLKNHQILLSMAYSGVNATSLSDGSTLYSKSFGRTESMNYCTTGEYEWILQLNNTGVTVHSVAFYDNNNTLVRNYVFNGTNFVDSITSKEATLAQGTLTSEDLGVHSVNYPTSYEELSAPVNNLTFSSLDEANAYTGCCYYGIGCTIGEDAYHLDDVNGKPTWVKGLLPSAYTKMDYLTASDFTSYNTVDRYLDLGLKFNTKYKFEMTCQANTSSKSLYYRFFTTNHTNEAPSELTTQWYVKDNVLYIAVNRTGHDVRATWSEKHTLVWDKGTFSVDGVTVFTDTQNFTTASNLCLLGCPNITGQEAFAGKLYSFKLWDTDGTTVLRNLIPCQRKSDSIYGMYDSANGVFYSSANPSYPFGGATA